jgi:serine protease inhibitor
MAFYQQRTADAISANAIVSSAHCSCYSTDAFKVVEIPYESEDISFVVILPSKTVADIRGCVEQEALKRIMNALGSSTKKTKVMLPTFEVAISDSIGHVFEDVGIDALFCENPQELDGIVAGEEIFVSNMTQVIQFKVDVDEVTSVTTRGAPVKGQEEKEAAEPLIADRPFIYIVWNKREQLPLIIGQLYNPRRHQYGSRD